MQIFNPNIISKTLHFQSIQAKGFPMILLLFSPEHVEFSYYFNKFILLQFIDS